MVNRERAKNATVSKNERAKFDKEMNMAKVAAKNGYEVEILKEVPGVSSPDVKINGIPVDFKSTASHNNIVGYAKKATKKQGARTVLFEIDRLDDKKRQALQSLKKKGINVRYYVKGEDKIRRP